MKIKHLFSYHRNSLIYVLKWLIICTLIGVFAGTASAFFLISLDWVTEYREAHRWIIWLLPAGGFLIGLSYHLWGKEAVRGNNLLIDEYHLPVKTVSWVMIPLVLAGTLLTHLFGGSAGREGTAVQMAGAGADRLSALFKSTTADRKVYIVAGISAGFASVFGTPLAGTVFALEIMLVGRLRYESLLPALLAAVVADRTCLLWNAHHTHYSIPVVPGLELHSLLWAIGAGAVFGLAALVFSWCSHAWAGLFHRHISYAPLRPAIGGAVLAAVIWSTGAFRYTGLGIPVIVEAFEQTVPVYDFALKTLFTTFTLGAGFKGGEVTPLFYVGATLGNALSQLIPLPVALLAGMGFVGVFSGATNTPIACTIMGMELFGAECGTFVAVACVVAYFFSGHTGIYGSQIIGSPKHVFLNHRKGERVN